MAENGTSSRGSGLHVQRLTFDNLSSISKRNDILFLSDYLQEQHSYAKEYASEGLTMFSSWNRMASPAPKTTLAEASTALDAFLLGTPVLKARAPAAPTFEKSSTILRALDSTVSPALIEDQDQTKRRSATKHPIQTEEKLPGLNSPSARGDLTGRNVDTKRGKEKSKENKKRKDERVGSDEEYLKRLQDRRERKRLKKSIMKSPAKESESEKENAVRYTKKKGHKKDKIKSQNFGLMHGFTATNVGKSRITLEPLLRNVGVFKKGKASCNHDVCFSEARFLGTVKAKAIKNADFKSSSASSSTSDRVHKKGDTVQRKKKKSKDKISVEDSNCGDIADRNESSAAEEGRHPYDPANSITWDIERDSYVEESEAGCRQGTIVLSFPRDELVRGDQEKGQGATVETPVFRADNSPADARAFIKTPDHSLHPSHSASQVVEQPKPQGIGNHSKYFLPEQITREKDGREQQDLYEGRRSTTLPVLEEKKPNRFMFHSWPTIEAHLSSPTLSQMISLDELPCSYGAFSLADVRSVFEDATMELDAYGAFHGPDAPQGDFQSRSDNECIHSMQHYMLENPDFSIVSSNVMERDVDFEDPPVEDSYSLLDGFCRQNILAYDGVAPSDDHKADDGSMTYEPASGHDTFSGVSDVPNLSMQSGSSEDIVLFPTKIDHFSQGRSLLYGLDHGYARVSDPEAEVARLLKQNHWLPHRL